MEVLENSNNLLEGVTLVKQSQDENSKVRIKKLSDKEQEKYYGQIPPHGAFFMRYKTLKHIANGNLVVMNPKDAEGFRKLFEGLGYPLTDKGAYGFTKMLEQKIDKPYGAKNLLLRMLKTYGRY